MLFSILSSRATPDLIVLVAVCGCHLWAAFSLSREFGQRWTRVIFGGAAFSIALLGGGFLLRFARFSQFLPPAVGSWIRGAIVAWAFLSLLLLAARWLARRVPVRAAHPPARRAFLRTVQAALFGAPVAALGYGAFIQRFDLRLREENIPIRDLPEDLDGLRLVQLTDIHLSPFLSERQLADAVATANETKAHIAFVTGDLISTANDPLDACLGHLAGLRAEAGVFGCMGNHEIYADAEEYVSRHSARYGMRFLRGESTPVRFGRATLNIAGVDYQRFGRNYLEGAEKLVRADSFNLLLSHNPDVFPVAARKGFELTLAGHTHGGQVQVEILHHNINVARVFTPFVDGLYKEGNSAIFVSRGIGTIGMPVRLGAPPEVALIRLCRT